MTSTPVKGVNPLVNYVSSKKNGNAADLLNNNFSAAFQKASYQGNSQQISVKSEQMQRNMSEKGNKLSGTDNVKRDGWNDKNSPVEKKDAAEKTLNIGKEGKTKSTLQETGEELTKKVADELGISVEEVQKAMELLGLTAEQLLIPGNMTQLVLNLEGADMLSLVTDGELYKSMQNLLDEVNSALDSAARQLGMSSQELMAAIEQMAAQNMMEVPNSEQKADIVSDNLAEGTNLEGEITEEIDAEGLKETSKDISQEEMENAKNIKPDDGQKDYTITVEKDGEMVEVAVKADEDGGEKSNTEVITNKALSTEQAEEVKSDTGKKNNQGKGNSSQENQTQSNNFLESLLSGKANAIKSEAVLDNTAMTGKSVDTQNIMNQIMDYMKIQVKTDLTQMEIQLHPASLGTVNVNITSKEGVITAQFMTQNESVKAAIESQVVQLKNNFEEQGIKIQAVEVTVESHQFERNLSGEGQRQEQQGSGKKKGSRKINLNELNAEELELNEAEQIAVEMMTADGTTVDYMA